MRTQTGMTFVHVSQLCFSAMCLRVYILSSFIYVVYNWHRCLVNHWGWSIWVGFMVSSQARLLLQPNSKILHQHSNKAPPQPNSKALPQSNSKALALPHPHLKRSLWWIKQGSKIATKHQGSCSSITTPKTVHESTQQSSINGAPRGSPRLKAKGAWSRSVS